MVSQELQTASIDELEVPSVVQDILAGRVLPPPVDGAELNERITQAMFEAETPEEALAAGATVNFEDGLLGVPVEVRDIVFRRSTIAGSSPVFLLADIYRLDEGTAHIVTTSAQQVMRTLAVWKARGWLPATFVVEKADTKTAEGFTPFTIKAA